MATFSITAIRTGGGNRTFQIEAASRGEAESQVRALGWEPQGASPGDSMVRADPAPDSGGMSLAHPGALVVLGIACLFIGPLLPVARVGDDGMNLLRVGQTWAGADYLIGILAGVCLLLGSYKHLFRLSGIAVVLMIGQIIMVFSNLDHASRQVAMMGDALSGIAVMPSIPIHLAWGWFVLFAGPILLVAGAFRATQSGYD